MNSSVYQNSTQNITMYMNETNQQNETLTNNEQGTSNETQVAKEEIEEGSVASLYPYWRANRIPSNEESLKNTKQYQPRPAKYKENYEDKGLKVFVPKYEVIGTVTTDTFAKLEDPNKKSQEGTSKS